MLQPGYEKRLILILVFSMVLHACGGGGGSGSESSSSSSSSSSGSADTPPTLTLPATLDWQENQPFTYTVSASGSGELSYSLAESADSQLFSIDASTGVLTANTDFDFETPTDTNQDGTYEITVSVSDDSALSTEGNLAITIQDVDEFQAVVTFPVPGSNIGGGENSFHIRGYVTNDGEKVLSPSNDMELTVNDVVATFEDDDTGNWIVEVPVELGENSLNVEISQASEAVFTDTVNVDNSPIPNARTYVTDGITSIYSIDLDNAYIVETNIASGNSESILSLQSISADTTCEAFSRLLLSNDGSRLAVTCEQGGADGANIIILQLSNNTSDIYPLEFNVGAGTFIKWVESGHIFIRAPVVGPDPFYLLDIADGSIKNFSVNFMEAEEGVIDNDGLLISETTVYSTALVNDPDTGFESLWTSFDLTPVINATGDIDPLEAIAHPNITAIGSEDVRAIGGIAYSAGGGTLMKADFNTNTNSTVPLNPAIEGNGEISFFVINEDQAIGLTTQTNSIVSVDLKSGAVTPIYDGPSLYGVSDMSVSPDNSELFSYSFSTYITHKISLNNYATLETDNLSGDLSYSDSVNESMAFDWNNQIIYRNHIISYSGVAPSDDPLLLSYNVNTGVDTTVLTSNDLNAYFGNPDAFYSIDDVTLTNDENVLWFAAVVFHPGGGGSEGIYAVNLQTKAISTINETLYGSDSFPISSYLSDYVSDIDGVFLTKWESGYLAMLDSAGNFETLIEPESPYLVTRKAQFDSQRNLVYFGGYYETGSIDRNTVEIVEYDMTTEEQRVVASNSQGAGLSFSWANPSYNESQQLIYIGLIGHLLVLDAYTGDRVVVEY
jgi:hypothetical protein